MSDGRRYPLLFADGAETNHEGKRFLKVGGMLSVPSLDVLGLGVVTFVEDGKHREHMAPFEPIKGMSQ